MRPLTPAGRQAQTPRPKEKRNESLYHEPDRSGGHYGDIGGGPALRADVGERCVLREAQRAAVGTGVTQEGVRPLAVASREHDSVEARGLTPVYLEARGLTPAHAMNEDK